jgi:hypothetical protein
MNRLTVTGASLISILLLTLHLTDDILHHGGMTAIGFSTSVLISVVWLYGALVLAGRRSGYIIIVLGSLAALAVPVAHITGARGVLNATMAKSDDAFFFIWTLMALSVTALFSLVLGLLGTVASFSRPTR